MSHNTHVEYIVAPGQQEFDITVPFLDRNHIAARVNGTLAGKTWITDSRIRLNNPPATGSVVTIRRVTPIDAPLVTFTDGSNLTKEELNTAVRQLLYREQETADTITGSLEQARIRLGDQLGVVTNPRDIADEVLRISELGDDLVNRFREGLAGIALNANGLTQQGLNQQGLMLRTDTLDATVESVDARTATLTGRVNTIADIVDSLTDVDGGGLATIIQSEADQRINGDTALATTLDLIGARNGANNAFIFNLNTTRVSPTESLGDRLSAISAANGSNLARILAEETARTTAVSAEAGRINVLSTRVDANDASITEERLARSTADTALTQTINLMGARNGTNSGFILNQNTVMVSPTETLGQKFTTMLATAGTSSQALVTAEALTRATADTSMAQTIGLLGAANAGNTAFILDVNRVQVGGGQTMATRLSGLDTAVANNSASIVNEATTRTTALNSLALSLGVVTTTVNNHTASITSLAESRDGVALRWGVELNNNGHIVGVVANNNAQERSLTFVADETAFVSAAGGTPIKIMSVAAGKVVFNSNVAVNGDLLVTGSINGGKLTEGAVTGVVAGYDPATINLSGTTPTRVQGLWMTVEKASSPIDIDFTSWVTFTHDAGGSFTAYVELVRSRSTTGGTVLMRVPIYGSGMANDTWQGPVPIRFLDTPGETGAWHYYVQIYTNVSNMTVQSVTARYARLIEMKNNTASLGTGTGTGGGAGTGGGGSGGGGTGGGGDLDPGNPGGGGGLEPTMPTVPEA